MTVASQKLPVNYSIRNIIDCILNDNHHAKKYSAVKKKNIYHTVNLKLSTVQELASLLTATHVHSYEIEGSKLFCTSRHTAT